MKVEDLSKDVRRLLMAHWTKAEIESGLPDPDYFFDQVVQPRLNYLRRQGEDIPPLRLYRTANGDLRIFLAG
jgi:hypothetical protein